MMSRIRLCAPDIGCGHCAMTIKRELASMAGVTVVGVDVASKVVDLEYADEEVLKRARAKLEAAGYPTVSC